MPLLIIITLCQMIPLYNISKALKKAASTEKVVCLYLRCLEKRLLRAKLKKLWCAQTFLAAIFYSFAHRLVGRNLLKRCLHSMKMPSRTSNTKSRILKRMFLAALPQQEPSTVAVGFCCHRSIVGYWVRIKLSSLELETELKFGP